LSARLVSLVLASGLPAYLRLPAVVMAHHAAPDGSRAFPSVGLVARSCGLHKRRARAILAELRELGILRPAGVTRFGTTRYEFRAEALPPATWLEELEAPPISTASTGFPQGGGYGQPGGRLPAASDPPVIDQETLLGSPLEQTTEEPDGDRTRRLELLEAVRGKLLRLELPPAGRVRRRAR